MLQKKCFDSQKRITRVQVKPKVNHLRCEEKREKNETKA